jgi:hypothetical protein
MNTRAIKRLLAGSVLLTWSALAALVPAADAALERASAGSRSHVEQTGGSATCPQVHDQACQLCRLLRLPTKSGDGVALFTLAAIAHADLPNTPLVLASRDSESGQFSRAPPSA